MLLVAATLPLLLVLVRAELYDVISPNLVPPEGGCMAWVEMPEQEQHFRDAGSVAAAGSSCVQQGRGNPAFAGCYNGGSSTPTSNGVGNCTGHYVSAYCVSRRTGKLSLCTSGFGIPEQVNIQIAGVDTVVVGWVTFEHEAPSKPPVLAVEGGGEVQGITHKHVPCTVGKACVGDGYNATTGKTTRPYASPL
jgi:hypothetical protein